MEGKERRGRFEKQAMKPVRKGKKRRSRRRVKEGNKWRKRS